MFKELISEGCIMEGFKILRTPNYIAIKHLRAKCCKTHMEFTIRLERDKTDWYMVYASKVPKNLSEPIKSSNVKDEWKLDRGLYTGSEYSCPYCGNKTIVKCGRCGQNTCNNGGKNFKCDYCSESGEIKGTITSVYVERGDHSTKK